MVDRSFICSPPLPKRVLKVSRFAGSPRGDATLPCGGMVSMRKPISSFVVLGSGTIGTLAGLAVLAGWCLGSPALIQLGSSLMPMHPATAVLFPVCGVALLLARMQGRRSRLAASALGALVVAAGCIVQLFPRIPFFDTLLKVDLAARIPRQVAPNSAVCFLLAGFALCLAGLPFRPWRSQLMALCGAIVAMLGALASLGYLIGNAFAYSWGEVVPMAAHTAAGFVLLGIGIAVQASHASGAQKGQAVYWLPLLIVLVGGTGNLLLWDAQRSEEVRRVRQATTSPRQIDAMENSRDSLVLAVGFALTLALAQAVRLAQTARGRAREAALANAKLEREIAERARQEQSLLDAQKELVRANAGLKAAHEQALQQEKLASIGLLAAGVAHEINNPMGFITSNLGTLQKYLDRLLEYGAAQQRVIDALADAEAILPLRTLKEQLKIEYVQNDTLQLIAESLDGAGRVSKIVNELKSFARSGDSSPRETDLRECLDGNLRLVWNELKYKATVQRDYREVPPVFCNVQQMNQVFVNLLMNAADAIEDKGEIAVAISRQQDFVCVAISDTGCGIPEASLKNIFDPFFTSKEPGKGTGLGLSISYDIVKKHGGDIGVASVPGKGSTFTVRLPLPQGAGGVGGATG